MYRADLRVLHERRVCDTCGEPIEQEKWAYVSDRLVWHRYCAPPILLFPDEVQEGA